MTTIDADLSATLELACALIRLPSITPEDAGCQALLCQRLEALGFEIQEIPFGKVKNFWAVLGRGSPCLVFAGHTDVVPTGPEEDWHSPPFEPTIQRGVLSGRGAADMKGSLAAMVVAVEEFVSQPGFARAEDTGHRPAGNSLPGSIAFLVTSDEEGPAIDGTRRVVEYLQSQNVRMDYCIVGEPSSQSYPGDTLRNGRRGSLGGKLILRGVQGHVAYPHLAQNPIHAFAPILQQMSQYEWDRGNRYFPPTSLQFSNISAGTGATNVIPGRLEAHFNIRFNTEHSPNSLQTKIENILSEHDIAYDIEWNLSGLPFLTPQGTLTEKVCQAIRQVAGIEAELSTGGGTSDGRFIAPTGCEVVELGPVNATIHQVDECVSIAHLEVLKDIYLNCLRLLLPSTTSITATARGETSA